MKLTLLMWFLSASMVFGFYDLQGTTRSGKSREGNTSQGVHLMDDTYPMPPH